VTRGKVSGDALQGLLVVTLQHICYVVVTRLDRRISGWAKRLKKSEIQRSTGERNLRCRMCAMTRMAVSGFLSKYLLCLVMKRPGGRAIMAKLYRCSALCAALSCSVVGCSVLLIGQVPRCGGGAELSYGQGDKGPDTHDKYMHVAVRLWRGLDLAADYVYTANSRSCDVWLA
jgi:hypothetical protein